MLDFKEAEKALLTTIQSIKTRPEMYGRDVQESCGILICLLEVLLKGYGVDYKGSIYNRFLSKLTQSFPEVSGNTLRPIPYSNEKSRSFISDFVNEILSEIS